MLAAMATAAALPNLSLISLATWSQTSCLREEITTLAPCSAIRSAMALPMPRVEPVMTATLPFMSNKLISLSQMLVSQLYVISGRCEASNRESRDQGPVLRTVPASSQLRRGRHYLRPRRLMHRIVRGIGDPWLLVDHRQPPIGMASTYDVI